MKSKTMENNFSTASVVIIKNSASKTLKKTKKLL